jgi:hypothetical protein
MTSSFWEIGHPPEQMLGSCILVAELLPILSTVHKTKNITYNTLLFDTLITQNFTYCDMEQSTECTSSYYVSSREIVIFLGTHHEHIFVLYSLSQNMVGTIKSKIRFYSDVTITQRQKSSSLLSQDTGTTRLKSRMSWTSLPCTWL